MDDDNLERLLYTLAAENQKVIFYLAIASAKDPTIDNKINKVIVALQKSNAQMMKLAQSRVTQIRSLMATQIPPYVTASNSHTLSAVK